MASRDANAIVDVVEVAEDISTLSIVDVSSLPPLKQQTVPLVEDIDDLELVDPSHFVPLINQIIEDVEGVQISCNAKFISYSSKDTKLVKKLDYYNRDSHIWYQRAMEGCTKRKPSPGIHPSTKVHLDAIAAMQPEMPIKGLNRAIEIITDKTYWLEKNDFDIKARCINELLHFQLRISPDGNQIQIFCEECELTSLQKAIHAAYYNIEFKGKFYVDKCATKAGLFFEGETFKLVRGDSTDKLFCKYPDCGAFIRVSITPDGKCMIHFHPHSKELKHSHSKMPATPEFVTVEIPQPTTSARSYPKDAGGRYAVIEREYPYHGVVSKSRPKQTRVNNFLYHKGRVTSTNGQYNCVEKNKKAFKCGAFVYQNVATGMFSECITPHTHLPPPPEQE